MYHMLPNVSWQIDIKAFLEDIRVLYPYCYSVIKAGFMRFILQLCCCPFTSPDYRHTENHLRLVIVSAVSTQTAKWMDRQMHGETDGCMKYVKYKKANIEVVASEQTLSPSLIMFYSLQNLWSFSVSQLLIACQKCETETDPNINGYPLDKMSPVWGLQRDFPHIEICNSDFSMSYYWSLLYQFDKTTRLIKFQILEKSTNWTVNLKLTGTGTWLKEVFTKWIIFYIYSWNSIDWIKAGKKWVWNQRQS